MRTILTAILCAMLPAMVFGGASILFDETDDKIDAGKDSSLDNFTEIAISAWIKPRVAAHTGGILSKDAFTGRYWIFRLTSSKMDFAVYNTTSVYHSSVGATSLVPGTWYHVVGTYDGAEIQVYLDAVADDATPAAHSGAIKVGTTSAVGIGQQFNAANTFGGLIGEVLLYNQSFSVKEIEAMYASKGAWYPRTGLVSRWSMENNGIGTGNPHPAGSIIKDSFGSDDGTVIDGGDNSMTLDGSSPTRKKRGRR